MVRLSLVSNSKRENKPMGNAQKAELRAQQANSYLRVSPLIFNVLLVAFIAVRHLIALCATRTAIAS